MSTANVIHDTSLTLQSLLDARLNTEEDPPLGAPVTVTIDSPHRSNHEEFRINLFLYNIVQDENRRNSGRVPLDRIERTETQPPKQRFAVEPMALRLYYLVTAFAIDGLTEHFLLGEAMAALHLNQRVPEEALKGTLKSSPVRAEHMQITQLNLDVDNLQKIWGSQTEPLRSSVAYEVEAVFLEASERRLEVPLVTKEGGQVIGVVPFPELSIVAPEAAPAGAIVRLYGSNLLVAEQRELLADGPPRPPGEARKGRLRFMKIWFGDARATILPEDASAGAVSVRVPETLKPGPLEVKLQLDRYVGRPVPFEVLPGGPPHG
jgi:hypothetical protein